MDFMRQGSWIDAKEDSIHKFKRDSDIPANPIALVKCPG